MREDTRTTTVSGAAAHARGLSRYCRDYDATDYDAERGWHCGGCDEWVDDDPEQREYWTLPDGRGRRQPCCRECAATYSPRHYGPDGSECYGGDPIQASGHGCEICDAPIYICGCGLECDEGSRGDLRGPHGCDAATMIAREDADGN